MLIQHPKLNASGTSFKTGMCACSFTSNTPQNVWLEYIVYIYILYIRAYICTNALPLELDEPLIITVLWRGARILKFHRECKTNRTIEMNLFASWMENMYPAGQTHAWGERNDILCILLCIEMVPTLSKHKSVKYWMLVLCVYGT